MRPSPLTSLQRVRFRGRRQLRCRPIADLRRVRLPSHLSEPLGGGMDIHKPKPWRGWPEFLKEIGTIVIGVLIALGAEQAVEALHWRHETHLAREALVFDFRRVIGFAAREDAASPCLAVRLDQLSAALD